MIGFAQVADIGRADSIGEDITVGAALADQGVAAAAADQDVGATPGQQRTAVRGAEQQIDVALPAPPSYKE